MVGLLVGLVHLEVCRAAGVRVEQQLVVGVAKLVQDGSPAPLAKAPGLVEVAERRQLLGLEEPHAAPQGVAHEHREAVTVLDHGVRHLGRQGVGHLARGLPGVHEAGVGGAHDEAKPRHDVVEALGALLGGHRAVEHAPGVREVAQQRSLRARELVVLDVGLEVRGRLEHVAQDRLGAQAVVARPRYLLAVGLEGGVELVLERLGVGDFGELVHALVVLEPLGLHLGEGPSARLALLGAKHLVGVLERGLNHGNEVEVVGVALRVQELERREQEGRERLVEREVLGKVDREAVDGRARKRRGRGGGQGLE